MLVWRCNQAGSCGDQSDKTSALLPAPLSRAGALSPTLGSPACILAEHLALQGRAHSKGIAAQSQHSHVLVSYFQSGRTSGKADRDKNIPQTWGNGKLFPPWIEQINSLNETMSSRARATCLVWIHRHSAKESSRVRSSLFDFTSLHALVQMTKTDIY